MPKATSATDYQHLGRLPRLLVVAAHPDDETIGCGALLSGLSGIAHCHIAHVTDGAPRDRRFIPSHIRSSREAYARLRREEAIRALSIAHIGQSRLYSLGAIDQEASLELVRLVHALVELLEDLRPDVVVSHPYEGGHPDHDAACFITHTARDLASSLFPHLPRLVEMSSYHGEPGHLVTGSFLRATQAPRHLDIHNPEDAFSAFLERGSEVDDSILIRFVPSEEDRARKAEMMSCFASQEEVLRDFAIDSELFRYAPTYDFARPPHEGPLYYEQLGWPMTGIAFRQRIALAQGALVRGETAWL